MSDHQCYLCGAQNDPSASFCSRCNGQLLSLGNEPEPEAAPEPEVPEVEEKKGPDNFSRLRQLRRKSTLDDSRLSDALGLQDEGLNDGLPEAKVSAIPKAKASTDIPIIGTLPGSSSRSLRTEAPERRVYVLFGLLVLATAWLAWITIGPSSSSQPENLAFASTTSTTFPTTTTTEAPIREWTEVEVESQFGDAMVIVQLVSCAGGTITRAQTSGINIDEHTTLIDIGPLPNARAARIFTPLGSHRQAVITTKSSGATVAVSPVRGNDHLRLIEQPAGDSRFELNFDPIVNQLEIETVAPGAQLSGPATQVLVTNQGETIEARIADRTFDLQDIQGSLDTVVRVEGASVSTTDACTWPDALAFASGDGAATAVTTTEQEELTDDESDDAQETAQ